MGCITMTKAWCIWCESGGKPATLKNGEYYWIHPKCAYKLMDTSDDIRSIREILEGVHPRNEKEKDKLTAVLKYISDMEQFAEQWNNIINTFSRGKKK